MPTTRTGRTQQVTVRVEHDMLDKVDALTERVAASVAGMGATFSRADCLRKALELGVAAMWAAQTDAKPAKKSKK